MFFFCLSLYEGGSQVVTKGEKLKAFLHYFDKMLTRFPPNTKNNGTLLTYERRAITGEQVPGWGTSTKTLSSVTVTATGVIEDSQGVGHLQVDFANRFLGELRKN